MRISGIVVAVATFVAAWGATAVAHHSAAQFDFGKSVAISCVVTKFQAINPHMRLVLRVKDAKGTREIEFEGHSTNNMYRSGYRDKMINVGDAITVNIAPLRSGEDGGYVVSAITASGARFGMGSGGNAQQERERAEGRGGAAR
jgi:hypothetical protein